MKENAFNLTPQQLKEIAGSLQEKINTGLKKDATEIRCIPTYIQPKTENVEGKALVLDLGGTNYRAAVVELSAGKATLHPENGWKKDLSVMKTAGFTQEQLFKEQADLIEEIYEGNELPIGYCFSYPAASQQDGDATLIEWTKGVDIKEMVGQPVGSPLMNHLNKQHRTHYSSIKVINDTVASLFAGLTQSGYDAYIGLIVGTGTNMAAFLPADKIEKIKGYTSAGLLPINLESGNFNPPHLTEIDRKVDKNSDNEGRQRFEKAVSGMYLGEILKATFPDVEFEDKFDALKLSNMLNYPDIYKEEYVRVALEIYERSARLVAASLAGLIAVLKSLDEKTESVCLTAEGSLFWSENKNGKNYKDIVLDSLYSILADMGHQDIKVNITQMDNANLIGSAIAALS